MNDERKLRFLDQRTAHLACQLDHGVTPRTLNNLGKEDDRATAV